MILLNNLLCSHEELEWLMRPLRILPYVEHRFSFLLQRFDSALVHDEQPSFLERRQVICSVLISFCVHNNSLVEKMFSKPKICNVCRDFLMGSDNTGYSCEG